MAYPATFEVQPPKEFDKAQVILRIAIVIVVTWLLRTWSISALPTIEVGSLAGTYIAAYIALSSFAAMTIALKGGAKYIKEAQAGPVKWLRYIMMFYCYMALATDKLQTQKPEQIVQFSVTPGGSPSVGQALLRIILGIPHAIVLAILGIVFAIVWLVAAVSILMNGTQPQWCEDFIRGYLRWNARLLAYMASLVEEYPPFSFSDGDAGAPAPATPAAQ